MSELLEPTTPDKRTAANRKNAKKSTGPKTDAGKARSAQNARKHGLTAQDAAADGEDPAAFQARLDHWVDAYGSDDPARLVLIKRVVRADWRLDRCLKHETAAVSKRVRHAEADFDAEQTARAEAMGKRLVRHPLDHIPVPSVGPKFSHNVAANHPDHPAVLAVEMQSFAAGAGWLAGRWMELARVLAEEGYWPRAMATEALRLMGLRPQDAPEERRSLELLSVCQAAHPDASRLGEWLLFASPNRFERDFDARAIAHARSVVPTDRAGARAYLACLAETEIKRLLALRDEVLAPRDAADRAAARDLALFDDSHAGTLRRRYETACERDLHRSIKGLLDLRKRSKADEGERGAAEPEQAEAPPAAEPPRVPGSPLRNEPMFALVSERDDGQKTPETGPEGGDRGGG